jgi:hypothetical protein
MAACLSKSYIVAYGTTDHHIWYVALKGDATFNLYALPPARIGDLVSSSSPRKFDGETPTQLLFFLTLRDMLFFCIWRVLAFA